MNDDLDSDSREDLLDLARDSIRAAVAGVELAKRSYDDPVLGMRRGCFVTLMRGGRLRGCIGTLEGVRTLADDVGRFARRAAFNDPRFPPLSEDELEDLEIHVSVLGPLEKLDVRDEEELLALVRPGVDGLVLRDGGHAGTFLPAVWDKLPDPKLFVQQLKRKAGIPPDHWPERIEVHRFQVQEFPS